MDAQVARAKALLAKMSGASVGGTDPDQDELGELMDELAATGRGSPASEEAGAGDGATKSFPSDPVKVSSYDAASDGHKALLLDLSVLPE